MQITTSILVSHAYGLLAPHISQQVNAALQTDEMLRWQYEGILQLMQDYPDDDPEELLEKMSANVINRVKPIHEKKQPKPSVSLRNWLLLAAVFILIIGTGIFFLNRNEDSANVFAQQIIKDKAVNPFDNITRGSLQNNDTTSWKAAFADNDFQTVVSTLEQRQGKSPEEQFFLAVSYLKATPPQAEKAEPLFIDLTKEESSFGNDAWLYLGLTQTLLNQKEDAAASLQHVEQTVQVRELEDRLRK